MPPDPPPPARRLMGPWLALGLVVGNSIGSGAGLLPASLAPYGWNAALGWAATLIGGMALAFVFARLAALLPQAGGPYAYTRAAFGPRAGFFVAWAYWANLWVGNAGVAVAPVAALGQFVPGIADDRGMTAALTVAVLWAATLINLRGAFVSAGLSTWLTVVKIIPIVIACIVGARLVAEGAPVPPLEPADLSVSAAATAATLTLWGLLGLESATIPANHVRNPRRTIPIATLAGTGIAALFTAAVALLVQFLLPPGVAAASPAPYAEFMTRFVAPWAGVAAAVIGALGVFGALVGWILLQGEMPAAMAQGGVFPRALGKVDARGTPVRAHLVASMLLTIVVALSGAGGTTALFTFLAQVAVLASLVAYLSCALAAVRLRAVRGWGVAIAAVAAIYSAWALSGAGGRALLWFLALMAAGYPIYLITARQTHRPL